MPVYYDGRFPAGVVGPGYPGHALVPTPATGMIKVRALPSRRVVLHADQRYYAPLGLPLPSGRLHHRLIRPVSCPTSGVVRRVSPVPAQTVHTCHLPYPGRTPRADPGTGLWGHGLRRSMTGSAPPLWI